MKIMLEDGAYMPTRAHGTDAGLDLRAMYGQTILPNSSATFRTGVHIELPEGTAGILVSKSGLNTNFDITSHGLIDEGYTGEIIVKLYNHGKFAYTVAAGDKISQLVNVPVQYPTLERVTRLNSGTERGNNGFGSSGK